MQLFPTLFEDSVPRYRRPDESIFKYYSRRKVGEVDANKVAIQAAFDSLPEAIKPLLMNRLTSERDEQHYGALFELWFSSQLGSLGYSVDLQPTVGGKTPDIRVGIDGRTLAYVECLVLHEESERTSEDRTIDLLYHHVRKHCRLVGYKVETVAWKHGSSPPSAKLFAKFIDENAPASHPATTTELDDDSDALVYVDPSGWQISVRYMPLADANRRADRLEGQRSYPVRRLNTRERTVEKIDAKRAKYRELEHPLIVAVSHNSEFDDLDQLTASEALLGTHVYTFDLSTNQAGHSSRSMNGVWVDRHSGFRACPSAVVVTGRCSVFGWNSVTPTIWYNPYDQREVRLPVWPFDAYLPNHLTRCMDKHSPPT